MGLDSFKQSNDTSSESTGNHYGNRTQDKRYRDEEWLREQYEEKGLSFDEIAEKTGAAYSTISKWANSFDLDVRGTNKSKYPEKEDIIEGLKNVADKVGEDFTARDVEEIEASALVHRAKKEFGSFNKAKKQVSSEIYISDNKKAEIPVDEDDIYFAYILGVVKSDGWVSNNRIGLDVTNKKFAQKFKKALHNLSSREPNIIRKAPNEDGKERYRVHMRWKKLFLKLKEEYNMNKWGKWITNLSEEQLKYYVQGTYESEGCKMESGYQIGVTDSNHATSFLYSVSEILNVSDDKFTYRTQYVESGFLEEQVITYVYIPSELSNKFIDEIEPSIKI